MLSTGRRNECTDLSRINIATLNKLYGIPPKSATPTTMCEKQLLKDITLVKMQPNYASLSGIVLHKTKA